MLLGVAAAVYAFERHEIIRQTWGTYAESENVKVPFWVDHSFSYDYTLCIGFIIACLVVIFRWR